ncbi:hypothetical protein [Pseudanabaena yagii]|uniref:Uncharacterized protein n=1 Tax=Pseudanabaena yagii GIHE-NHR1 TaxID=2722753 RepID=A0ABX1LXM3_9CYAN|nr:hypothetical protein [Pseudanabaena yagii]NMF60106.1 hypothetical protein [Pseudanabaena yagii GIHE-NHR1]
MNNNWQENMQVFSSQVIKNIKSNAVAPANFLAVFGVTFFLGVMITCLSMQQIWFAIACFVLAAICVIPAIFLIIYFALKDPDRLQTERYLTENRWIDAWKDVAKNGDSDDLKLANLIDSESPIAKPNLQPRLSRKKLSDSTQSDLGEDNSDETIGDNHGQK